MTMLGDQWEDSLAEAEVVLECPAATIPNPDRTSCIECEKPCGLCKDRVDKCTTCHPDSDEPYLYEYKCLKECPEGYHASPLDG